MKLAYGNTHALGRCESDAFLTDEAVVADSLGVEQPLADAAIDSDDGERWNRALWALAFDWFRADGVDATLVDGISAGDIGGAEAAQTIFLPAARAVLGAGRRAAQLGASEVVTAVSSRGGPIFGRIEALQCDAFEAAVRTRLPGATVGSRTEGNDERDDRLVAKYARVRDPDWLAPLPRARLAAARLADAAINTAAAPRRRGRSGLLVFEYNPTRSLALRLLEDPPHGTRLVRYGYGPPDILPTLRAGAGSVLAVGAPARLTAPAARRRIEEHLSSEAVQARLAIDDVPLAALLAPQLARMAERYCAFVADAAPRFRRALERRRIDAVVVPFDSPPLARLLVRVAQAMDIPTLVLANGLMADDFQAECMTADWGLAWCEPIATRYFARRPQGNTEVVGNPKADVLRAAHPPRPRNTQQRILVGSFTYSPADVNCRRSDSESFLAEVLEGIRRSGAGSRASVTVKLHPADPPDHYEAILTGFRDLDVSVVGSGDVTDLFDTADVYVTTYSTSLVEAAAVGLPIVYYRINDQHLHPPFAGDEFLEPRTAATPESLARLLDATDRDASLRAVESLGRFAETYLGRADGGSVERVVEAVRRARDAVGS